MSFDWNAGVGQVVVGAALILPGFVSVTTWETLVPSARREYSKAAAEFLGYSAINYILLAAAFVDRLPRWATGKFNPSDFLLLPTLTVLVPAVWPLAIYVVRKNYPNKLLRDPTPTAWDKAFGSRKSWFVRAHLKDGRVISGYMGRNSYAAEYPFPPSLFLETLYREAKGQWKPVPSSGGMVIQGEAIEMVEFVEPPNPPAPKGD